MSAATVFGLIAFVATAALMAGLVATLPSKTTDLTGWQALIVMSAFVALFSQLFAIVSR